MLDKIKGMKVEEKLKFYFNCYHIQYFRSDRHGDAVAQRYCV